MRSKYFIPGHFSKGYGKSPMVIVNRFGVHCSRRHSTEDTGYGFAYQCWTGDTTFAHHDVLKNADVLGSDIGDEQKVGVVAYIREYLAEHKDDAKATPAPAAVQFAVENPTSHQLYMSRWSTVWFNGVAQWSNSEDKKIFPYSNRVLCTISVPGNSVYYVPLLHSFWRGYPLSYSTTPYSRNDAGSAPGTADDTFSIGSPGGTSNLGEPQDGKQTEMFLKAGTLTTITLHITEGRRRGSFSGRYDGFSFPAAAKLREPPLPCSSREEHKNWRLQEWHTHPEPDLWISDVQRETDHAVVGFYTMTVTESESGRTSGEHKDEPTPSLTRPANPVRTLASEAKRASPTSTSASLSRLRQVDLLAASPVSVPATTAASPAPARAPSPTKRPVSAAVSLARQTEPVRFHHFHSPPSSPVRPVRSLPIRATTVKTLSASSVGRPAWHTYF